jgi:beta-glucosidase
MYVQHLGSSVSRPRLELKGFKRVRIEPGNEQVVPIDLAARDLAYWDTASHAWRVEKERVRVLAGGESDNLPVSAEFDISGSKDFKP